ncbi:MAG: carbon-nitrogen hydrolase family protein [Thermoleophilaceae bacterium]
MRPLSIAALQTSPVFGDPDATLRRMGERVARLRGVVPHVRLVMFPELHLPALPPPLEPHADPATLAVDVPGPLTDELAEIARANGVWLVPGSVYERADDGRVHNTALVLSPEGELTASYRKVFPWQPHESSAPGDRFVTFDVPEVGRLGLSICYDGSFPETCRELAWMGAEAVLQVSLTTTSDRPQEIVMARANAIFNQLYVVSLNAGSPAGLGRSVIVDPEGLVRLQAGDGEELLTDVLDLDAVTRVREYGTGGVSRLWDQATRTGVCARQPRQGDGAGE